MKPYTRSIIELFDGKKRYLIPLYQRQYAWKVQPQLELLWEDIERAADRVRTDRASLTPHFLGAIVIAQIKTFGKEVQAFEIIDGQQRLTSFQILLAALRDVAATHSAKWASELRPYLLNEGVMAQEAIERFKLWPSRTDRRAFIAMIDPSADIDAITPPAVNEDGFVRRAISAHAHFKDVIERHVVMDGGFDEFRFETLFEAMKAGLAVVSIELEGGDDPQTIFETLNSRGVDLTPGDLMRNFIFQRAKGLGQNGSSLTVDSLYEKHWLPLDRAFWNQSASRGRQARQRLDWMLTDHLSMKIADLVSVDQLFESYRRWILNDRPFESVANELEAITATASVEKRLFDQEPNDPIGDFGLFADAFDVSTAMPLVIYLATEADLGAGLSRALEALKSYILRRDICGLPNKNYNRLFVGMIAHLRKAERNRVDALISYLSTRIAETDRWPDNSEWRRGWMERDQYKGPRQSRLRYIFEAIERAKRSVLSEDIEIKSTLTIEHIMPQVWSTNWPIPGFDHLEPGEFDPEFASRQSARSAAVNKLGNLTLLTQALNSSVSNGPYSVKMPAVRSNSSLALNRDLNGFDAWNEETIAERGAALFNVAQKIWLAPERDHDITNVMEPLTNALPSDGTTRCRFTYSGAPYHALVQNGALIVDGVEGSFASFSAASKAITSTSRNGWNDWYIARNDGDWILADEWRRLRATVNV
ncbi:hypothetical protein NB311A_16629 [Nitrobacter sp. Nb-311A]|uniref:DUF262 domain-containing protein n=1 Tax=Nitrobacter sp. Nb-311A TaxID=314253 RepID=UPI0000685E45|nr:DUF262 domain-containing protein [Nitrobacter sp. Nb-311A]EAQ35137.1 hypothetical protein NB311A_16629 [Nitrobacter sp. Nb-311A]